MSDHTLTGPSGTARPESARAGKAPLCVLLAGGGSGGHIFPSVAIAERVREREAGALCRYLVSDRPLDSEILLGLGEDFDVIPARPPGLRPRALVRFITSWGRAVRAGRAAVRAAREQAERVVVVATGGFVSAPACQGARAEGAPVVLVNLDSAPGKASRFVGRFADACFTPEGGAPSAWERISPLVRDAARAPGPPGVCRAALGLAPDRPTLLVTGASQGAGSINRLMEALLESRGESLRGWQVIHQTGAGEDIRVREAYERAGAIARVEAFFPAMGSAWGAADLALSRAGAGSVGEAWANRVPALFLPYPYHRDEHQRLNARALEQAGAAEVVRDEVDPERNLATAGERLAALLLDEPARARMRAAFASLGPADGAERVAERTLSLARGAGGA